MAEIQNLESLIRKLRDKAAKAKTEKAGSVTVGYTQAYAIYVHENLEAYHKVGQAKYLEQPARQLNADGTIVSIIKEALRKKNTMSQALVKAGLKLQRESQLLVPVDTGALKNSAFTRLDTEQRKPAVG